MEEEINEIVVETYEYKKAEAPDILCSGGLGPCIAVGAIYGKKGYMTHYVPCGTTTDLDKLLKDLKKEVKNFAWLKIYIAGGGIQSGNSQENVNSTLEGRKKCLDRIAETGFRKYIKRIQWAGKNISQELILYLSERKADYEEDEIPIERLVRGFEED